MIGERSMHACEFDFRHVAGSAVLCADRTRSRTAPLSLRFFRGSQVTGKTLRVVIRCLFLHLLMRIMTSQTAYARIVCIVTTTVEYPVRLEANVVDS